MGAVATANPYARAFCIRSESPDVAQMRLKKLSWSSEIFVRQNARCSSRSIRTIFLVTSATQSHGWACGYSYGIGAVAC